MKLLSNGENLNFKNDKKTSIKKRQYKRNFVCTAAYTQWRTSAWRRPAQRSQYNWGFTSAIF
uniref:Uncharacterized protein n=1 Tax=Romanomermis culicivorax TaxID=13658 RepID=A0A915JEE5_ROMCU